jgi:hypothetical protein
LYYRHRIIGFAYLGLDINNLKLMIDHINRDTLNNCVDNLRIVSSQQNNFNRTCKGYCWHKRDRKYHARIRLNGKYIHLGCYDNEEDARQAYLKGKAIYHII